MRILTLYGEALILSPNTTCPRFSEGAFSSPAEQKSKLKRNMNKLILINWERASFGDLLVVFIRNDGFF